MHAACHSVHHTEWVNRNRQNELVSRQFLQRTRPRDRAKIIWCSNDCRLTVDRFLLARLTECDDNALFGASHLLLRQHFTSLTNTIKRVESDGCNRYRRGRGILVGPLNPKESHLTNIELRNVGKLVVRPRIVSWTPRDGDRNGLSNLEIPVIFGSMCVEQREIVIRTGFEALKIRIDLDPAAISTDPRADRRNQPSGEPSYRAGHSLWC